LRASEDGDCGCVRGARRFAVLCLSIVVAFGSASARAAHRNDPVTRATLLQTAESGITRIDQVWWNPVAHWYTTYPWTQRAGAGGLATLWDAAPLFETIDLVALADPTSANKAAVTQFAVGAERYWDPLASAMGAYVYLPDKHKSMGAFFDDDGWWGLGFFDAYRATGNRRFLRDTLRAFDFIELKGWAPQGGVWWSTDHTRTTAEPLAAEALLGALLYERTHATAYLRVAERYIAWADKHIWNASRGLYQRAPGDPTVLDYVEGMMIGADAALCRSLHRSAYCRKGEALARAAAVAFPPSYHWAPETDAIYLRWLLELYKTNHHRQWYDLVNARAQQAYANARDPQGLFTKNWDGSFASNDRLLTDAGTLMLFAALAGAPAP